MRTSMPYAAGIYVTREHIAALRDHGPGACLTWHEDSNQVNATDPVTTTYPNRMVITGYQGLGDLANEHLVEGREVTDEDLACDLTDMATDYQADWAGLRTMSLMCQQVRRNLADMGVYLSAAPTYDLPALAMPRMTDYYRLTGGERTARVTIAWGFTDPTKIVARDSIENASPVADLTLDTSAMITHRATSNLIASTVMHTLDPNR